MDPSENLLHSERIAQHADWIRALARSLVRDPALADDLSQDTLAIALAEPPPRARLKGWLATILRNRLRRVGRRDTLRRDAEESVAFQREPAVAMAEVSRHHELVGKLLELPEGYREALVLRYFEQASHAEIAERLGIAEGTVRTRLTRGLDRLRRKVEESQGLHSAAAWLWLAAGEEGPPPTPQLPQADGLLPWEDGPLPTPELLEPAPTLLGLPLPTAAGLLTLSVTVALAFALWRAGGPSSMPALVPGGANEGATPGQVAQLEDLSRSALAEASQEPTESNPAEAPVIAEPTSTVSGQLIDWQGQPLAGLDLVYRRGAEEAATFRSDTQGRFEFPTTDWLGEVRLRHEGYVGLLEALLVGADPGYELTVVAAATRTLGGRILDTQGRPLPDAIVSFRPREDFRPALARVLHFTSWREWRMLSAADGSFVFEDAAVFPGVLEVNLPGYGSHEVEIEEWDAVESEICLEPIAPRPGLLFGRVVDANGQGLGQAAVGDSREFIRTGPEGQFQLDLDGRTPEELVVCYPGYLPVRVTPPEVPEAWTIRLERPSLTLRGKVVDVDGRPLPGVTLKLLGAEYVSGVARDKKGVPFSAAYSVESLLSQRGTDTFHTDAAGTFAIDGLQDRAYQLQLSDEQLRVRTTGPLHPSEDSAVAHELVLFDETPAAPYTARVVDLQGQPIQGLVLRVARSSEKPDLRGAVWSAPVVSDAEGLFHLENIAWGTSGLFATSDTHPRYTREFWALPTEGDLSGENLPTIVVREQAYVQVDLDPAQWPDEYSLAVIDARGRLTRLSLPMGEAQRMTMTGQMSAGLSPVYGVPCDAQRLIVASQDAVVMERALELQPGQLYRVQR